jgi:DNA repair protein RecN (Recombination protein N)
MLKEIIIENLTLVEKVKLNFHSGLICVTGESGAGKSALLYALKVLSGQKFEKERIRNGCEKATIEAVFVFSKSDEQITHFLDRWDLNGEEENTIHIHREVQIQGKSKARINGYPANQNQLQELGDILIHIQGQSEQIQLRDLKYHLDLLDRYADTKYQIEVFEGFRANWSEIDQKIKDLKTDYQNKKEQRDFFQFQLLELEKADLKVGEEDQLRELLNSLESASEIQHLQDDSMEIISQGNTSLLDQIRKLELKLDKLSILLPSTKPLLETLLETRCLIEDLQSQIGSIKNTEDVSLSEIDNMNSRMAFLQRIQRKFKLDHQGLIELREKRKEDVESLDHFESSLIDLTNDQNRVYAQMKEAGLILSEKRIAFASKLDQELNALIHELDMQGAIFYTNIERQDQFGPLGFDKVEFYISPNAGEGKRPLRSTLSGGELSRVMLAMKTILADKDRVPIMVFDEIDSGISGETGHKIGSALAQLGKYHQVFTISHLQQVAAKAQQHLKVVKKEEFGRTHSEIIDLDQGQKIQELARMMGASSLDIAKEHAKSLLNDNSNSLKA